ncbi:hypothetical protein LguiB_032058 [Lonicera macranthoides]
MRPPLCTPQQKPTSSIKPNNYSQPPHLSQTTKARSQQRWTTRAKPQLSRTTRARLESSWTILVEKILRIQPNVKKLLLLLRNTDTKSAPQRLHDEVLGKELFKVVRKSWGETIKSHLLEKVIPISGDISFENMGIIDSKLREEMSEEIDIIVNSAATTSFDERYDVSMGINTLGAMHVVNFAKRCPKLQLLLHVSTSYVCGKGEGVILEKPFKMGESLNGAMGLDINAEKRLVEETLNDLRAKEAPQDVVTTTMKVLGIQRADN